MNHADTTAQLIRAAGTPPSACPGPIDLIAATTDSAQAGEGEPGTDVPVSLYRCAYCGSVLSVSDAGDGRLRLRNSYAYPGPATGTT